MAEGKALLGKNVGDRPMYSGGQFAVTHEFAGRFHGVWIRIGHPLRGRARLALDERAGEFDPIAARSRNFERVEKEIIGCDFAMAWNFKTGVGLAMLAGEENVHHARTRAASKEALDRGRHDFRFRLSWLVAGQQGPEAIDHDIHCVANFNEFLFTLHGTRQVKFPIERYEFKWT